MSPKRPGFSATSIEDAISIRFNSRVYELQRAGKPVIVLSLGEPFFDLPLLSFKDLPLPALFHYSDSRGLPELRRKICADERRRHGVDADPDREIIVTAGSKAAIYMALSAVLDPGDEVVYPEPAWVSYSEQIKLCGAVPVGIPMGVPLERCASYLTRRTKVLIVNNPHNPTGKLYTRRELLSLLRLARARGIWLFCDESYGDFAPAGTFHSLGALTRDKRGAAVFSSLSKNLGMSGWRLGYAIASEDLIARVLKINQHLLTCPATVLEHYVARHFARLRALTAPQLRRLQARRAGISSYLRRIGLSCVPGETTFYFFVSIAPSRLGSVAFCERLLEESGVSVVPGIGYGKSCDRHVRVSIGACPDGAVRRGLDAIKALVDRTS